MKKIKKSPKQSEQIKYSLEISCPTRWNTVIQILNSFKKNLSDINLLYLNENVVLPVDPIDIRNIDEILLILTPFNEGILKLSQKRLLYYRRDCCSRIY